MSSDSSSVDAATIEQTKQQIRGLVHEITRLSKSDLAPEQYYGEVMQRIVTALAAIGGAVWTLAADHRLRLDYQVNLSQHLLDHRSEDSVRHLRLLQHVLSSGQPQLVAPLSGSGQQDEAGNPTNALLVLAPLVSEDRVEGVLEVFQRPDAQPQSQQGYLRFLVQMSELVGEWLNSRKLRQYGDRQSLWSQVDYFAKVIHDSLDVRETAYTIANEGRRLIGCDRLTIAVRRGNKQLVEAVSGQDNFDSRSNVVSLLGRLTTRVAATGEPLWYDGTPQDLPPQVEDALDAYIDQAHTKTLAVLPLARQGTQPRRDDELGRDTADEHDAAEGEILGALIIEQIDSTQRREVLQPRVELVRQHSARALSNAIEHNNLFLMPVWRALGRASWLVRARTLPKTLAVVIAIVSALLALWRVQLDFKLQARGNLQPVQKRDVFFDVDGVVLKVPARHGQQVQEGDLLVELRNTDLDLQLTDLEGRRQSAREQLFAVERAMLDAGTLPVEERNRLAGQLAQLKNDLFSLDQQINLLLTKRQRLQVTSPSDGQVVTWNVEDLLLHRPVLAGQVAMKVADPTGPWELEVFLPEDRMGHLLRAYAENPNLEVDYILATDPGTVHQGRIEEIHTVSQLHDEHGQCVRLRVAIDKQDVPDPRPGATVIAKLHAGRRAAGYVWFHEVLEFVQARLLF